MIGLTMSLFSLVTPSTPLAVIVLLGGAQGFFNGLQFTSMITLGYADIDASESSMAATIASSLQQMAMSFALAAGSIVTAWYLGGLSQSDHVLVTSALHKAFLTMAGWTMVSSAIFWVLRPGDGAAVSDGKSLEQ
jgi:hypothetical protein